MIEGKLAAMLAVQLRDTDLWLPDLPQAPVEKHHLLESLVQQIAEARAEILGTNYSELRRQLVQWNQLPEDEFDAVSAEESDRVCRELCTVEDAIANLHKAYFHFLALVDSVTGTAVAEAVDRMPDLAWLIRAEALTRRQWLSYHEERLAAGHRLESPFSCRVADWPYDERKHDREFYQLIEYLHWMKAVTGEEYVIDRSQNTATTQDPPDFIVRDRRGHESGVEVTEVPISQEWAEAQRCAAAVRATLVPVLETAGKGLRLWDPDWCLINQHLPEITALISHVCASGQTQLLARELGVDGELPDADSPRVSWSSRKGETAADIEVVEEQLARAILARLKGKLEKDGEPRRPPTIRPCDLVLYPNGAPFVDASRVEQLVCQQKDFDHRSHFARVLLASETCFFWIP